MPQLRTAGERAPQQALNRIPLATYRLQLRGDFDFADVQRLADYLKRLGITDLYLAPLFRARRDSSHGYDVVDPSRIEPEFGDRASFTAMARGVQDQGMGILLDVVPNHMGINDPGNRWWNDVLENGRTAQYASHFDIDWDRLAENLRHKILLPLLGDHFGEVLEQGELTLQYLAENFFIAYHHYRFPVTPRSWPMILSEMLGALQDNNQGAGEGSPATDLLELQSIETQLRNLPPSADLTEAAVRQRYREQRIAAIRLSSLRTRSSAVRAAMEETIQRINGTVGQPESFDTLERLLDDQHYRLAYWRVASDEINYRRFFDINDLAAVRVERPEVFAEVHALLADFLATGEVTGLRIDHPDGLLDPGRYFDTLQKMFRDVERQSQEDGHKLYIVVEKILTGDEPLPTEWPISGTTGYDLMNDINRVLVDAEGTAQMRANYPTLTGLEETPADVMYHSKKHILREAMASEVSVLAGRLHRVTQRHRFSRDFTFPAILRGLREIIACFPVYRTYVPSRGWDVSAEDYQRIMSAVRQAKRRNSSMLWGVLDFLAGVLLLQHSETIGESERETFRDFVLRFQQVTGPVTAKGIEDTAFYRYYPLASLNEVGGELDAQPLAIDDFHRRMQHRAADWPHGLSATATHDTKRGEDLRARLNVLSEMAEDWTTCVRQWQKHNATYLRSVGEDQVPNRNEAYLIYQTLVGTWPLEPMDWQEHAFYLERLTAYFRKALREAKLTTSWSNPAEEYEQAVLGYLRDLLDRERSSEFLAQLDQCVRRIAHAGFINSLAQVLIKVAAPGVPDFYQGTEFWDFHLVDPDNRRSVDYQARQQALAELEQDFTLDWNTAWQQLRKCWPDDRIKLFTVWRCLALRKQFPQVFTDGDYLPIRTTGDRVQHVLAWARRYEGTWLIAVTVLRSLKLTSSDAMAAFERSGARAALPTFDWGDTRIELPVEASSVWNNAFTKQRHIATEDSGKRQILPIADVLHDFPIALLYSDTTD